MKKIGEAKTMLFEGYLILSLDKKWLDVFGELPTFEASLDDDGKLHLTSTKSVYKKKLENLKRNQF
ncbi:MAG: hypothetical protein WAL88_01615 [Nitrosotalea sp.]